MGKVIKMRFKRAAKKATQNTLKEKMVIERMKRHLNDYQLGRIDFDQLYIKVWEILDEQD